MEVEVNTCTVKITATKRQTSLSEGNRSKKSRNGSSNRWSGLTAKEIVLDLVMIGVVHRVLNAGNLQNSSSKWGDNDSSHKAGTYKAKAWGPMCDEYDPILPGIGNAKTCEYPNGKHKAVWHLIEALPKNIRTGDYCKREERIANAA